MTSKGQGPLSSNFKVYFQEHLRSKIGRTKSELSKLIDIISDAPNELFLDKIFFNIQQSKKIDQDMHLLTLKKIHKKFLGVGRPLFEGKIFVKNFAWPLFILNIMDEKVYKLYPHLSTCPLPL